MNQPPKLRIDTEALLKLLDRLNSTPDAELTPEQRIQKIKNEQAMMALARVSPEKRFEIIWKEAKKRGLR